MVQLIVYTKDAKEACTQRVLILLEELELKYELSEEENNSPLSPFDKGVVVNYGDRVLFESRSILRYIARNNKEPDNLLGDVNCDVWLEVESQHFSPYAKAILEDKDNEDAKNSLEKTLDVYEEVLQQQEYIGGDNYSIADIAHIPYAYVLLKSGAKDLFKKRPNVYSWLKRIMRRDAVKRGVGSRVYTTK